MLLHKRIWVVVAMLVLALGVSLANPVTSASATSKRIAATAVTDPPPPPKVNAAYTKAHTVKGEKDSKKLKGKPTSKERLSTRTTRVPTGSIERVYSIGYQATPAGTTGNRSNLRVGGTYLDPEDGHTLGEISVESANEQQAVELGWRIDPSSSTPKLFVYHWIDNVPQGYGVNFVDNAANTTFNHGTSLTPNKVYTAAIQLFNNNWWLWWEDPGVFGDWVGYFPGSLWTGSLNDPFNEARIVQNFGELATNVHTPCSDMGHAGILGGAATTTAAYFGTYSIYDGTAWVNGSYDPISTVWSGGGTPDTSAYNGALATGSTRTFYYGGPGYNSIGTTPGAANSCAPATQGTPTASAFQLWAEVCPDNQLVTGCNAVQSFTWSSMPLNVCTVIANPGVAKINAVWNNSLSSGKTFKVYRTGTCGGTAKTYGNAAKEAFAEGSGWDGTAIRAVMRTA
jgi:hypothetical protein